jgi:hypothetical protein
MRKRLSAYALIVVAVLTALALGFNREYVLSADGLVGVKAARRGDKLVVSGSIRASGARITKVTTTESDGDVLIRVYADRVSAGESERASGRFTLSVPLNSDVRSIRIGENSRIITAGRLFGVPLRIPRGSSKPPTDRVLWTRT